jgi:hypothetical protein
MVPVISHVVLMKPRPDLSPEDRRFFVRSFERAVTRIPDVRQVRIGTRLVTGARYDEGMPDTGEFLAVIDFDDLDGLLAYLRHPEHEALGRLFYQSLSSAFVYDYEVGGLEILGRI